MRPDPSGGDGGAGVPCLVEPNWADGTSQARLVWASGHLGLRAPYGDKEPVS